MKSINQFLLTALITLSVFLFSYGGSTTGSETVNITSDIYTSNWTTDGACTSTRAWNAAADSFSFTWKTGGNDQIVRIGKRYSSTGFNVQVDNIRSNCIMSTSAEMKTLNAGSWYMWSIYGWTHPTNSGWPSNGWNEEFYIVFQGTYAPSGYQSLGSVTIDGAVFDCYLLDPLPWANPNQAQWLSICRTHTWSASIDLKKMFTFWRSKGMPNDYVVDLTWALEGYSGSSGSIQMSNIVIPGLKASSTTVLKPVMAPAYPSLQAQAAQFSLSGRIMPTLFTARREASSGIFMNDNNAIVLPYEARKN